MNHSGSDTIIAFERALKRQDRQEYDLKLYITGASARSIRAISNIKQLCEQHLKGRYHLQVIDVYQQPALAEGEQILAAPTLIKRLPKPLRRIIGDLSNRERVLLGLDLRETHDAAAREGQRRPDHNDVNG